MLNKIEIPLMNDDTKWKNDTPPLDSQRIPHKYNNYNLYCQTKTITYSHTQQILKRIMTNKVTFLSYQTIFCALCILVHPIPLIFHDNLFSHEIINYFQTPMLFW